MTLADRFAAAAHFAVGPVEERGVLRLSGRDRQGFLHRLCSQDVEKLAPGSTSYAAFLEPKGHVISDALVLAGEAAALLLGPRETAEGLAAHLRRYVLRDDVAVDDLSAQVRCVPVLGEVGVAAIRTSGDAILFADARRGAPAVDAVLTGESAVPFRAALVAAGAAELTPDDLEGLRIAAGHPRFGPDFGPDRLLTEAGIAAAVSFQKGCYPGQEVVLRSTFRGQVQRGLVQLALPAGAGPGTPLRASGQEVGLVTSAAETPRGRMGLGLLRRAHWEAGTRLDAGGGEAVVVRPLVEER